MSSTAIGIIGGSGLYAIDGLEGTEELNIETPYGQPSSPVISGVLEGMKVFFIARHGTAHQYLPSEVNYRANIYALKQLGAEWCLAISAVGSLTEEMRPGDIVFPDQFIDRTSKRKQTFYGEGIVAHVSFADPVCTELRATIADSSKALAAEQNKNVFEKATYVCMEGPAFSSRAESHMYRSWNAHLIGMTAIPEAKLAREAELSYCLMALVTDYDCWRSSGADVDIPQILEIMRGNVGFAKSVISNVIPKLSTKTPSTMCSQAMAHAIITNPDSISPETKQRLGPLLQKYM